MICIYYITPNIFFLFAEENVIGILKQTRAQRQYFESHFND